MGLDKKDVEMMCISVPTVDYWEMKEEIERLSDCVERLEKIVDLLIVLYREERVKNWELILQEMLKREEDKKKVIRIKPIFKVDYENDEVETS
jgi:hypothetical protein